MKKQLLKFICVGLIGYFATTVTSCTKDPDPPDLSSTASFIIGSKGSDQLQKGLYKVTVGSDPVFISQLFPYNYSSWYADYNNGMIAFAVSGNQKGNTSGIAYMSADDLENIQFAPIPGAPVGFYYSVSSTTPRVLGDGRIAYLVALETDNEYDSWFAGEIAIYNPLNGEIELSGDPSEFVLNQPEIGDDTEDGTMKKGFVVSPDDKYVYCEVYGYGTDGGEVHRDYSFIVRYTIGIPGSYERLAQMEAYPAAVTADGNSLLVTNGSFGVRTIDLQTKAITQTADFYFYPSSGQISQQSSRMLRTWIAAGSYGAGFGEMDFSVSPYAFTQFFDENELVAPRNYYPSLSLGVQYSADESRVYFGVYRSSQSDKYNMICSTPKTGLNETPDSLTSFHKDFNMNVLILLDE
ncbi:MAG: hypothetical protein V2B15_07185 [Bacteroidota bacterium]